MSLNYQSFLKYPIKINGIDSTYDSYIKDIEDFLIADLAYSGTASDLDDILPYFTFFLLCQDKNSTVDANVGESTQVKEFTEASTTKQIKAWNIGVDKLRVILEITQNEIDNIRRLSKGFYSECDAIEMLLSDLGISINEKYLSKISLL